MDTSTKMLVNVLKKAEINMVWIIWLQSQRSFFFPVPYLNFVSKCFGTDVSWYFCFSSQIFWLGLWHFLVNWVLSLGGWAMFTPKFVNVITWERRNELQMYTIGVCTKILGQVWISATSKSKPEVKILENPVIAITQEGTHLGFWNRYNRWFYYKRPCC